MTQTPPGLLVARLLGEGGGAHIYCLRSEGGTMFRVERSGDAPCHEHDAALPPETTQWHPSLACALADLPWAWHRLHPVDVAPAVGAQLLALKRDRDAKEGCAADDEEWATACELGRPEGEQDPVLLQFLDRLSREWLPRFCQNPKYEGTSDGFRYSSVTIAAQDAADFMRSLDEDVVFEVKDKPWRFRAALSNAEEQIFWEGRRGVLPRPLTLWLEPVITIAAAGRLHVEFGWPKSCIGLQSRQWEFDLVAHMPGKLDTEFVAAEVKKTARELDVMVGLLLEFCKGQSCEPTDAVALNAYRKYQGLLRRRASLFWAVGPRRYTRLFEAKYPDVGIVNLSEVPLTCLRFPYLEG